MYVWVCKAQLSIAAFAVELNCMLGRKHTFFFFNWDKIQYTTHTHTQSLWSRPPKRGAGGWSVGEGEQNMGLSQPVA